MMDLAQVTCEICHNKRQVRFCRECTRRSCMADIHTIEVPILFCAACSMEVSSDICGTCGTTAEITSYVSQDTCPFCGSSKLGEPELLLKNLPSDFYSVIVKVEDIAPSLADLFRSFDFMVALVRFCRLAGFLGFPQMEQQLQECSLALQKLNQRSLRELNQIRQEALYDLRRLDYFKNIDLMHFRNAEAILQTTSEKIDKLADHTQYWIAEIQDRLDQLKPLALFLRQHYELLAVINRYMPEGIHDVAAIIPPISMNIKLRRRQEKGEAYIIFTEECCVFLPKRALTADIHEVVNGIKVPYSNFLHRNRVNSVLKGTQLLIRLDQGEITVSAPPQVLDRVEEYFELIYDDQPYMVGSAKKITTIEAETPDKYEFKRASQKFINIFREWLFGTRVQKQEENSLEMPSMKELMGRLSKLEQAYRDINYKASNLQIDPDEYQMKSSSIKQNFESIRESLSRLGGHFDLEDGKFQ